jgi:hypothetical protein
MSRLWLTLPLLAALALAACDDGDADDAEDPGDSLLDPPGPDEGVQFAMTTTLEAGVEAEHCKFMQAPDREMWVTRDEARFDQGSHHVLLYETEYDAIPTKTEDGQTVDTSRVFDCTDGATRGWRITKLIGGSQNSDGDSMLSFPPGVAMPVRPGAVLLMNVHYINASDQDIEPEARINLYTVPEEEVDTEGDLLFLYNPLIRVPARGSARARWRCPVDKDITIANVQSHMHARGVGYAAMITGEEPFYENDRWSDVEVKSFEPALQISAGQSLDYYCDYQNDEDHVVYQGARSTDEMCMLIGSYYPADPGISACEDENGDIAGEWVGEGTATCADTMTCILNIDFEDGDPLPKIAECVLASDPSVSRETSDLARCLFSQPNPVADCPEVLAACQAK